MTGPSEITRLLERVPELANLVRRFGRSIEETDVLVKLATASGRDPELGRVLTRRFQRDAGRLELVLEAEVSAGRLVERDAAGLRKLVEKARRDLDEARIRPPARPAKGREPPRRVLTRADVATTDGIRPVREHLLDTLGRELDRATMQQVELLTDDDWDVLVRRAVTIETPSVRNLKGLVQELYTSRLPAFADAVEKARKQFVAFKGSKSWRFEVWYGLQALDRAGRKVRQFADKGAFAVTDGPPVPWVIPLMFWEDKNESNVGDLLGEGGQIARLDHRAGNGLIRYGGKDYFVSEQIMDVLFPRVYGAAPALPGQKAFMTLPPEYRTVTRIYETKISSAKLDDIAKRVFRLVGR